MCGLCIFFQGGGWFIQNFFGLVGMQKLSPVEFFTDSHLNYSNSQQISKHKGKNTPQWETQAIDFSQLKYYNFNLDITIDNFYVPVVLPLLSLSLILIFLLSVPFSSSFSDLPSFASPYPFITSILTLITTAVLLPGRASWIFFSTLLDSSHPFWNSDFWGLFALFRLFHLYLMRQR